MNSVVERLFSRINEAEGNATTSTTGSLPNVIQRIVSNPALPGVEAELRSRFNTINSRNPQLPQQTASTTSSTHSFSNTSSAPAGQALLPAPVYNPLTRSSGRNRRRKRTIHNVFKDEPTDRILYKDFILLSLKTKITPRVGGICTVPVLL